MMLFPHVTSGTLLLAGATIISAIQLSDFQERGSASAAVYWATNDPDGNYVLSASVNKKGQLDFANKFWTGGLGGHGTTDPGTNPDGLFSQSSVVVVNNSLVVTNAGSSTVSLFVIDASNPTHLRLAGAPIWSGGEFPVSATIDKKTGNVCVLNSGSYSSVSCYTSDVKKGLRPIANTIRSLNLNSTTPPTGPAHTPSQVLFSEDGAILYASIKGAPGAPGFIAAWKVDLSSSTLSAEFEKNTPKDGGALPFSMTFIDGTNAILTTDPALGLSVYDFDGETTKAKSDVGVPIQGQMAACWSEFSAKTESYYVTDIGTSKVTEVQVNSTTLKATIVTQYAQPNGSATIDLTIASTGGNDYAYVLAPGTLHIETLALVAPGKAKKVESFDMIKATKWAGVALNSTFVQGIASFSG